MTYQQTINYLFSRLPIYQREGETAYKSNIDNIVSASKILSNPHDKFKSIHIAGTNGKGSVSHMLSSILHEAGYKVGLYTSPHLKDFRERIKINGKIISELEVVKFVENNKINFEKIGLSFFEFTVALAFNYFANKKVDIAIIEKGLGGRLDSTNIITPELSIITNIGLDHIKLLGNTIEQIAKEKAGIIKQNVPVVIGRNQVKIKDIFQNIANKKNTHIKYAKNHKFTTDLKGDYQKENINTVITAILEIQKQGWKITKKDITKGLLNTIKNTGLLGRWQTLNEEPLIICDIGHNEDAIKANFKQIQQTPHKKLHIIFGLVNDKNLDSILNLLPKHAKYYFCKSDILRGLDQHILKNSAKEKGLNGKAYTSIKRALKEAKKQANYNDLIFIGGSTFVVAEVI
ncbi:MAG: folylpolyglutamate synthase/dihydrofolate synthase family protein [Bacteroidota bacterium]|nr:folylpolyglutamate synthase/dihydrofolate synthase family protein [Bacteroidota bacterium]